MNQNENLTGSDSPGGDMSKLDRLAGASRSHTQHTIKFAPRIQNTVDGLLLVRAQLKRGNREWQGLNQLVQAQS
jgi:hypothetical protein